MKIYYRLFFLFLLSLTTPLGAQTLMKSHGKLPAPLTGKAEARAKAKVEARKNESELMDESEVAFTYLTEYSFASFASSGKLTTGDTVTRYAERILDKLLVKDQKLRRKIKVYLLRSTEVNAYMMGNGALLLSTGMIAHVENEAQLAFILSHEVIHFRERHNLQGFRNRQRAEDRYFDPMGGVLRFTRELELEADEEGAKIFKAAGYALHEGYAALQLLEHHDWSFGQEPFYPSFFEHGDYRFPAHYTFNKIEEVEPPDHERDESRSTHPGIQKRLRTIAPLLGDTSMRTPLWQISESGFHYVQDLTRREVVNLYLEERNYPEAIYGAYVLLKQDTADPFPREVIGKALYNLAIYYSESEIYRLPDIFIYQSNPDFDNGGSDEPDYTMQGPEDVPGECQRLVNFFHQLSPFEWTILALDWNWQQNLRYGFTEANKKRCSNLIEILKNYESVKQEDFSTTAFSPVSNSHRDEVEKTIPTGKQTKVSNKKIASEIWDSYKDRRFYTMDEYLEFKEEVEREIKSEVRKQQRELLLDPSLQVVYRGAINRADTSQVVDSVYLYYKYAFVSYFAKDDLFRFTFEDARDSRRANPYDELKLEQRYKFDRYGGTGLGVNLIAVMEPEVVWLNEIKRTKEYDYDGTRSGLLAPQQESALLGGAKNAKVDAVYFNPERMDSLDSTDYSTYCMLKAWLNERNDLGGNAFLQNTAHNNLGDSLAARLGTPYLMTSVLVTKHQKRIRQPGMYVFAILVPMTTIPSIIYGIVPRNRSRFTTVVYDLRTGEMVMLFQDNKKAAANGSTMMVYYNEVFQKLKKPEAND